MAFFPKPPLDTIPSVCDRWTPLYLEHGRLEVDDSSVKWIGADGTVVRIPIATLSALCLGPGTTVTHAAVKACAECDTPICWVGEDSFRFYAYGVQSAHDAQRARLQAELVSSERTRNAVARKMFSMRFTDIDVSKYSVNELRGFEGRRVRKLYQQMGMTYGVAWQKRQYSTTDWYHSDEINRAISAANAALYSLTTAVVTSMGYLPQLGFIHTQGMLAFVYDIADIYKPITTLPAAFETVGLGTGKILENDVVARVKGLIESEKILDRMPVEIERLVAKP